jgi:hypothetical protein
LHSRAMHGHIDLGLRSSQSLARWWRIQNHYRPLSLLTNIIVRLVRVEGALPVIGDSNIPTICAIVNIRKTCYYPSIDSFRMERVIY